MNTKSIISLLATVLLCSYGFDALAKPTSPTPEQRAMREKLVSDLAVKCASALEKKQDQVVCDSMLIIAADLLLLDGRFDKSQDEVKQALVEAERIAGGGPAAAAFAKIRAQVAAADCPAMQSEAKGNLKALYVAEEAHRGEFDKYSRDLSAIGYSPRASGKMRYKYIVTVATSDKFTAMAVGEGEADGDVWELNEKNELKNTTNLCAKTK